MKSKNLGNTTIYLIPAILLLVPVIYAIFLLESTVKHERSALFQEVQDSHKGALFGASRRLSEYWHNLEQNTSLNSIDPLKILSEISSDSLILYDSEGKKIFPLTIAPEELKSESPDIKVAKLKLHNKEKVNAINDLLKIGEKSQDYQERAVALLYAAQSLMDLDKPREALEVCNKILFNNQYHHLHDYQGNLIYPEILLIFLQIEPDTTDFKSTLLENLILKINDYNNKEISTQQRVQIRKKLLELYPILHFPLLQPEEIALKYFEKTTRPDRRNILQKSILTDLWQFTVNGNVVLLFTADNLENKMLSQIEFTEIPDKTMLRLNPPGQTDLNTILSIDATSRMPGWTISINFIDPNHLSEMINQRIKIYRLAVFFTISLTLVLIFLFVSNMQRQLKLAELKNDLVANVTHELKTPLASSRLLLDTLLSQNQLPAEKIKDYLEHLSAENNRLCRLVDHFLTFSRLEKNLYKFHMKIFTLDEFIDNLNDAIHGRLGKQKERIISHCTEDEISLKGDITTLIMVILNLLENGLKFSSPEKNVFLNFNREIDKLTISVKDEGIGIPEKEHKKIFEQYYQVDNLLSRKYEGSGLGLNMIQTILTAHGSKINLTSEPGKGSEFSFQLQIVNNKETT